MPAMPHEAAGPRIEPPVSEPVAPAHRPAATATPDPLDEPLGVCSTFHGLRGAGYAASGEPPPNANSSVVSFPSMIAPARLSSATQCASSPGTQSPSTRD